MHAHEPRVSERLSKMFNVTLTSHTGGGSVETAMGFEKLVMQNVEAVLEGREALTAVNQRLVDDYHSKNAKETTNGVNGHDGDMNCVDKASKESENPSANGETINGAAAMEAAGTGKVNNKSASTAVGNT